MDDQPSTSYNFLSTIMPPSIDRVKFQVERLANGVYNLEYTVKEAGDSVVARGKQTVDNINDNFTRDNQTIKNVEKMIETANHKFSDWPIDALYAVFITALILIVFAVLYLAVKGGEKIVDRKYKRTINDPSDIERI